MKKSLKKAVVIAVTQGEKFFLSKRLDSKKPFFNYWQCPGGGVEPNENLKEAACRELSEEMGINVSPTDLTHISTRIRKYKNGVRYKAINYHLELSPYSNPEQTEPHKSSEWELFSLDEIESLEIIPGIPEICKQVRTLSTN